VRHTAAALLRSGQLERATPPSVVIPVAPRRRVELWRGLRPVEPLAAAPLPLRSVSPQRVLRPIGPPELDDDALEALRPTPIDALAGRTG
jgi:hypothetical protein